MTQVQPPHQRSALSANVHFSWQTKMVEKVLKGHDAIAIAGTGTGKSLIFAMLAGFGGVVIVICPLKSLQKEQVFFEV